MRRYLYATLIAVVALLHAGCEKGLTPTSVPAQVPVKEAPVVKMQGFVVGVTCTKDGKTLAYGNDRNRVYIHDIATGKLLAELAGHNKFVSAVQFSPDGTILASGSDDTTIRLWDVATGKELATLEGHTSTVRSLGFSNDGKTLASGSIDDTLRLWDVTERKAKAKFPGESDGVALFSPDDKTIITGGENIKIWDAATGKVVATREEKQFTSIYRVAMGAGGSTLATARTGNDITLWRTNPLAPTATLQGHTDSVYSLAFSPDGKLLASGAYKKQIKVWDTATRKELLTLSGRHGKAVCFVQFIDEGKTLLSASYDGVVEFWNLPTGRRVGDK